LQWNTQHLLLLLLLFFTHSFTGRLHGVVTMRRLKTLKSDPSGTKIATDRDRRQVIKHRQQDLAVE
jgi:hypothetical protein